MFRHNTIPPPRMRIRLPFLPHIHIRKRRKPHRPPVLLDRLGIHLSVELALLAMTRAVAGQNIARIVIMECPYQQVCNFNFWGHLAKPDRFRKHREALHLPFGQMPCRDNANTVFSSDVFIRMAMREWRLFDLVRS